MSAEPGTSPEHKIEIDKIFDLYGFNPDKINISLGTRKDTVESMMAEIDSFESEGPGGKAAANEVRRRMDKMVLDKAIAALDGVPRVPTESTGTFEIPEGLDRGRDQLITPPEKSIESLRSEADIDRDRIRNRIKYQAKKWVVATLLGVSTAFGAFTVGKSAVESSDQKAAVLSEMEKDTARLKEKNLEEQSEIQAQTGGITMAERVAASAKGVSEIPEEEVKMPGTTIHGSEIAIQRGEEHVAEIERIAAEERRVAADKRLAMVKKMSEGLVASSSGEKLKVALEGATPSTGETEMASIHDVDRPEAEKPDQPIEDTGTVVASD